MRPLPAKKALLEAVILLVFVVRFTTHVTRRAVAQILRYQQMNNEQPFGHRAFLPFHFSFPGSSRRSKGKCDEERSMVKRREFLKRASLFFAGVLIWLSPFFSLLHKAFGEARKIILPKGTPRETLIDKDPATLDARNLEITPLDRFGTMGLSDYREDLEKWRLEIRGQVKNPLTLTYQEIRALNAVQRNVLLICPGFFANYGMWKGVSIAELLKMAKVNEGVTRVTVKGPEGEYGMVKDFKVDDVLSDKVFLAYEVNGKPLPERHGYPLRVVAEGYYGFNWVKFVYSVTAEKIEGQR
jgi:DMSO/TMAO reductase YedYZ molybdopterin-dependent catalytic subunit